MWSFVYPLMGSFVCVCVCTFLHSSENCPDKHDHKNSATAVNNIQSDEQGLQMTDDAEVWKIGSLHVIMLVAL